VAERHRWPSQAKAYIAQADECVAECHRWASQAEGLIAQAEERVAERHRWPSQAKAYIAQADECVAERHRWASQAEGRIAQAEERVAERHRWPSQAKAYIVQADECVDEPSLTVGLRRRHPPVKSSQGKWRSCPGRSVPTASTCVLEHRSELWHAAGVRLSCLHRGRATHTSNSAFSRISLTRHRKPFAATPSTTR
jgi:hypothetical protein